MSIDSILLAEVLLPLKVEKPYTYIIPSRFESEAVIGKRVLVSFGKNKYYTGLITEVYHKEIDSSLYKPIEEILDSEPILNPVQLELWRWLSEYYLSSLGEVMDNALPNYFILNSERFYQLSAHAEWDIADITSEQEMLLDAIRSAGQVSLMDIQKIFDRKQAIAILYALIDKGWIEPVEIVQEKYKPIYKKTIKFSDNYQNDTTALNSLFSDLSKSKAQYKILTTYLSLLQRQAIVDKVELLGASAVSSTVLQAMLKKQIFVEEWVQKERFSLSKSSQEKQVFLSSYQEEKYQEMKSLFQTKSVNLLHGITSSGKTEIYIRWIQDTIDDNETILYILPEIALTQQIVSRISQYLSHNIIVYHSLISADRKYEIWNQVLSGRSKIIIGTRSALFLPFRKLDKIIIDEEHDQSLKQTNTNPKFHARDTLIYYAQKFNAKVLLGSATPSLESYQNVLEDKYGYIHLNQRYGDARLPDIQIIDLSDKTIASTMQSHYSEQLLTAMRQRHQRGEQTILFQNRRGYAPYLQCHTCGNIPKCLHCDVSLTYHSYSHHLLCHYCNTKYPTPKLCPQCYSAEIKTKGLGTQKIEEEIKLFLPEMTIARLDTDIARSQSRIDTLLDDFRLGKIDVLVGTQMISKGLDFENMTLLGIVQADILFSQLDFRSDERAYQVISQAAGRAGRGDKRGLVMIQTYQPRHRVLLSILNKDWQDFVHNELTSRKEFLYPPFCKIIKIEIKHLKPELVDIYARKIALKIKSSLPVQVLGPSAPPVSRIRNQYIKELIIKLPRNKELQAHKNTIKDIIENERMTMTNKNFSIQIIVDL